MIKSIFKKIIIISLFVFSKQIVFAQDADKTVIITVSGSGKTQDDAKQNALRSAIEQAFGTFISAKTEILNDKIMSDQITSVANGNIQSFSILNESQLPDGSWGTTLKALVSVSKLKSFVEAKGIAVEIKGGLFALNIKQQMLNEEGEIKAVTEMVGLLHEPMQISFDYVIKSSDPKSLDTENKNWEIPLVVTASANKNMDFCSNYCIKTLAALSLSSEEVTSYQSLNKAVFPVVINYNGVAKTFYLRKQGSINALNTLISQWEFYTRLFTVQSGMEESNGKGKGEIYSFGYRNDRNKGININFLTGSSSVYDELTREFLGMKGQQAATFSWKDNLTLSQIEQMTGYTVKPRGVVTQFKNGRFMVYEKDGHNLVANVNWNGTYPLYCLTSDVEILPKYGEVYEVWCATNENPTPFKKEIKKGTSLSVYKFANYDECLNWCNQKKGVNIESLDKSEVFSAVEEMPEFPGGAMEMMNFVGRNIQYPQTAKEAGLSGKCFLKFVVNKYGNITNIQVKKGIPGCGECDNEAIRVVQLMPKWKPGTQNGKNVSVYFNLPINFQLK